MTKHAVCLCVSLLTAMSGAAHASVVLSEDFESGAPGWSVTNSAIGNPVNWVANLSNCGELANYTNGAGEAACASSELQMGGSGAYDTELRSPVFDLSPFAFATLAYSASHQHNDDEFLDLDVSTDAGATWSSLLRWQEDHGADRATPGEDVSVDLTPYAGESDVMIRWRYFDPVGESLDRDWYSQIDSVLLEADAIPEPGTMAFAAIGALLIAVGLRSRSRQAGRS